MNWSNDFVFFDSLSFNINLNNNKTEEITDGHLDSSSNVAANNYE